MSRSGCFARASSLLVPPRVNIKSWGITTFFRSVSGKDVVGGILPHKIKEAQMGAPFIIRERGSPLHNKGAWLPPSYKDKKSLYRGGGVLYIHESCESGW